MVECEDVENVAPERNRAQRSQSALMSEAIYSCHRQLVEERAERAAVDTGVYHKMHFLLQHNEYGIMAAYGQHSPKAFYYYYYYYYYYYFLEEQEV
ncbi:unnamed protein product [Gadus morhua 'NCC']